MKMQKAILAMKKQQDTTIQDKESAEKSLREQSTEIQKAILEERQKAILDKIQKLKEDLGKS